MEGTGAGGMWLQGGLDSRERRGEDVGGGGGWGGGWIGLETCAGGRFFKVFKLEAEGPKGRIGVEEEKRSGAWRMERVAMCRGNVESERPGGKFERKGGR